MIGQPDVPSTLVELIRLRAGLQPDAIAYRFLLDGETRAAEITYAELDRRAREVARRLQAHLVPGDRALLQLAGLDFIVAFAGCLYAGVIAVPAPVVRRNRSASALQAIADDCRPGLVLTLDATRATLRPTLPPDSPLLDLPWLAIDEAGRDVAFEGGLPDIRPATIAFLQYTSGSTSLPKGVMLSHGNLMHNQAMIRDACHHSEASVVVGWLPLFHDMGLIGNVLQPLYLGVTGTLIAPEMVLQKPVRWLQAISRYRATTSGGPNFIYDLCVDRITGEQAAGLDLSSWQVAFNGAEPVRPDTLARFADRFAGSGFDAGAFHPCYGLAEATLRVTGAVTGAGPLLVDVACEPLERHRVEPVRLGEEGRTLVGCGAAVSSHGVSIAIVDPATREALPAGRVGEIWIKGPNVAQGYWQRPVETEKTFRARLADGDGPYLRTGDKGFVDRGELFITGRIKDLIILFGRNIYPHDVEQVVQASDEALERGRGAAFTAEINGREELVVAQEISLAARHSFDPAGLSSAIRRSVASHFDLAVREVVLLAPGGVPRTTSGKVRRLACREHFLRDDWPAKVLNMTAAADAA
jgi:acyl-CoA synthetase (AMP-forming)/AMP-acid ligase II